MNTLILRVITRTYKREIGFTMVELLVVFVILTILIAIAIPGFSRWAPKYHLRQAANQLHSDMQLSKLTAIKQNQDCAITFTESPPQYVISLINKTVNLNEIYEGEIVFGRADAGLTVPASPITFNSRGIIQSSSGVTNPGTSLNYAYITNAENSAYYEVGVTSSGNVATKKWDGSQYD